MSKAIDRERFIALLNEKFPEVAAQIDDIAEGLPRLEMADFSRATQAAIDSQDQETVKRHFGFIDEVFRNADPDVENAVNASHLENLAFEGENAHLTKARGLLPPKLQQALIELEKYLAELHSKDPYA